MTTLPPRQPPKPRTPRASLTPIEIRWPTVALVAAVVAGIVAVFAFAGPDERSDLLGILAVLGTTAAAVMRAAFGAEAPRPKRIEAICPHCGVPHPDITVHQPGCPRREDDNDPGAGGEVLADGPPTRPTRVPERVSAKRPERQLRKLAKLWRMGLGMPAQRVARLCMACLALTLSACSPSALQTHATIASITGHVFDEACAEVEVARSREQHAIADGPLDREASTAAVEVVRAHWVSALASCELAADTHDAWVTALALAAAGAPFTLADGIALAQSALSVWQSLAATLAVAGVEMPALPAELVALTGGAL